ncbi:MAG: DUF748 domain-containing protein [Moraxellaceae bacterium]|nr:DUF748 domain-containing protein [Moraxellaceae bacterium]
MTNSAVVKTRRRWPWIVVLVGVFSTLTLVTAMELWWPDIVERRLEVELSQRLGLDVSVKHVNIDAFDGRLTIDEFSINDGEEPMIGFEQLILHYSWRSFFSPVWLINSAELIGPRIHVLLPAEGPLNLLKLVPPPSTEANDPIRWHIGNLTVRDGMLDIRDETVAPARGFTLSPWQFELSDIGTDSADGLAELHGDLSGGARLDWVGKVRLNPLSSEGTLRLNKLPLADAMRWAPDDLPVRIRDGRLSVDLSYEAALDPELTLTLNNSAVAVEKLRITQADEPVAKLDQFNIKGINLAWPTARWGINDINIRGGDFNLQRNRAGDLTLIKALSDDTPRQRVAEPEQAKPVVWTGSLRQATVDDVTLRWLDQSTRPASQLSIGPISLQARPIQSEQQDLLALELSTAINNQGKLSVVGDIGMPSERPDGSTATPFLDARISASDLQLSTLNGYIRDQLHLRLSAGILGLAGNMKWQASGSPAWSWEGDIELKQLTALDDRNSERLLSLNRVLAKDLAIQGEPNRMRLARLQMDSPWLRAAVQSNGQLNLSSLVRPSKPKTSPTTTSASTDFPARIDAININNGTLVYLDKSRDPAFSYGLRQLNARLRNIDLGLDKVIDIDLSGRFMRPGNLIVKGKLTPNPDALYSDINITISDKELSALNSYAGQYAGYLIQDGTLDSSLNYRIENGQLQAQNQINLKGFSWGEATGSADATGLPVRLATTLLRDMNGNIRLDVPLSGNLNDPDFRVFPIVMQVIGNIITRAAAAPFKLLGALVGGSEDENLNQVEFDLGKSDLSEATNTQLAKLAQALSQRADLKVEIGASIDREQDRLALIEAAKVNKNKTTVTENSLNALAKARANAISSALINAGVGSNQVTILDSVDSAARNQRVITELGLQLP